mgnify:CR=1 FL=1
MTTIQLYSEAFIDDNGSTNKLCVRPSMDVWERIMNNHQHFDRIFIRIHHPTLDNETFLIPMGDPVPVGTSLSNSLFLPTWILDTNLIQGCGEETFIETVTPDHLPKATKIVLRPIDSLLLNMDVVEQLQPPLSALGCLQENKQYNIPLEAMDGYTVPVFVAKLEPSHEVFLDGDEIPLEFEEAVDSVPPRPPTPMPAPPPTLTVPFEQQGAVSVPSQIPSGILPHTDLVQVSPSSMNRLRRTNISTNSAFVPFSGEGRRLGGP